MLFDFNDILHEFLNNFVLTKNVKFEDIGYFYRHVSYLPL